MLNNDDEKAKLVHFGVLGMKWGRRLNRSAANATARDVAIGAAVVYAYKKNKGTWVPKQPKPEEAEG